MANIKDDDDFWYSSEKRSFSFENNEVDQLFGVSKNETEKLWADLSAPNTSEGSVKFTNNTEILKPILSVISDKTLACILAVNKKKGTDVVTTELQPEITLRKILLSQPYTLEQYKSLADKTALLDEAILSGNGSAILAVILFITKTLKKQLVQNLLAERPVVVNIYVHYLMTRMQTNEMIDILTMLGQSVNAAMKNLHIIIKNTKDPNRLLQKLRNCYKTQFSTLLDCKEAHFVGSYIKLLEWQNAAKETDEQDKLKINSSVLQSLQFTCENHWNAVENNSLSPMMLSSQQEISQRQYQKVILEIRAAASAWEDIERILITKGWLGSSRKLQTALPIKQVLNILHKSEAPIDILEKYLKYVDNVEERIELAKKYSCFRIVIDTFIAQGDRTSLIEYKTKLQPQSEGYFYAESVFRLPSIKWKN